MTCPVTPSRRRRAGIADLLFNVGSGRSPGRLMPELLPVLLAKLAFAALFWWAVFAPHNPPGKAGTAAKGAAAAVTPVVANAAARRSSSARVRERVSAGRARPRSRPEPSAPHR